MGIFFLGWGDEGGGGVVLFPAEETAQTGTPKAQWQHKDRNMKERETENPAYLPFDSVCCMTFTR